MSDTATQREDAPRDDDTPTRAPDRPGLTALSNPIGLIGLQGEGCAAALALLHAGHAILACDETRANRDAYALLSNNAPVITDPAELALKCTTILLFLAFGRDTATIHDALIGALSPGSLIIDLGPSLPGQTRRIAAELANKGLRLVDAVILPTTPAIILAGGAEADLARATPILASLGDCEPTGPVGSAQALSALLAELDEMPDRAGIRALKAR